MRAIDEAVEFLRSMLIGGPQPTPRIKQWAKDRGISDRTLDRAKKEAGVVAERQNGNNWVWRLAAPINSTANATAPKLAGPANATPPPLKGTANGEMEVPEPDWHTQFHDGPGQELSGGADRSDPECAGAAVTDVYEPELSVAPDKPGSVIATIDPQWVRLVDVIAEKRDCGFAEAANWLIEQGYLRRKAITKRKLKQQGDS